MNFLISFLSVLTAILTCIILVALLFIGRKLFRSRTIHKNSILEISLENGFIEFVPDNSLSMLTLKTKTRLRDFLEVISKAALDNRIAGLLLNLGPAPLSFTDAQEIRDALEQFKRSGKPSFAFTETFGEGVSGNSLYYCAVACDQVFLQPSGELNLNGMLSLSPFIKGALDKLGIIRGSLRGLNTRTRGTCLQKQNSPNRTKRRSIKSCLLYSSSSQAVLLIRAAENSKI